MTGLCILPSSMAVFYHNPIRNSWDAPCVPPQPRRRHWWAALNSDSLEGQYLLLPHVSIACELKLGIRNVFPLGRYRLNASIILRTVGWVLIYNRTYPVNWKGVPSGTWHKRLRWYCGTGCGGISFFLILCECTATSSIISVCKLLANILCQSRCRTLHWPATSSSQQLVPKPGVKGI